jgi:heme/copper-type cytochrome/quinol oxidase subunit 1
MTTIHTSPEALATAGGRTTSGRGLAAIGGWAITSDHKRIGRLFVGVALVVAIAAAVLGLLLGLERIGTDDTVLDAGSLPQVFSAFRVALVYGLAAPLLLGLAVAIVPLQLGARSLAFPRVALAGFWAWVGGLAMVVVSLARNGGPGGGDADMVDLFLAGHGVLLVGLAAAAGCVATSVLTSRAPGMTMRRVPVFAWSALVGSLGILLVTPVLFGVLVYQFVDHRSGTGVGFGGNTGIGPWSSWAFTVPTVLVFAVPALGVAVELLTVTFRTRLARRGAMFAGIGLAGAAAFAGVTQQDSFPVEFDQGFGDFVDDAIPFALLVGLPVLGVLAVLGLGGLAARRGRPRPTGPFLLAFFGLGMVFVGALGTAAYQIVDLELLGTVFEEGALVYVVDGAMLAGLAGIAYWAPKLWGRTLPNLAVVGLALLGVLGTILASLPYYVAGFLDQPAGAAVYAEYDAAALLNTLVLVGHGVVGLTVLAFAALAVRTLTGAGAAAGDDPWDGHTLEWATSSPAPTDNFADVPSVRSPEPLLDLKPAPGSDA